MALKFAAIDDELYRRENHGSMTPCVDSSKAEQLPKRAPDGHGHYAPSSR